MNTYQRAGTPTYGKIIQKVKPEKLMIIFPHFLHENCYERKIASESSIVGWM